MVCWDYFVISTMLDVAVWLDGRVRCMLPMVVEERAEVGNSEQADTWAVGYGVGMELVAQVLAAIGEGKDHLQMLVL